MAATVHLNVDHLTEAQNQKHASVNAGFDRLDGAVAGQHVVSVVGGINIPEVDAAEHMLFDLTGSLGGNVNVTVPDAIEKLYVVRKSATGGNVTFKTVTGSGVTLSDTDWHILYADGTDVFELNVTSSGGISLSGLTDTVITSAAAGEMLRYDGADWVNEETPYDVGAGANSTFASSQVLLRFIFTRSCTIPGSATGSQAVLGVAPSDADLDIDMKKNASSFGTLRFAQSTTTPTWVSVTQTTFNAGDVFTLVAPGTVDTNAADLAATFKFKRN